jgi:MFS family permease
MTTSIWRRNFSLLWIAGLISIAGNWMLIVAVPLSVLQLTHSTVATGLTIATKMLPQVVLGPLAGVYVDRWDRRRTLIWANLASAVALAPLLLVDSASRVWIVYPVLLVLSIASQFLNTAENALLPSLVDESQSVRANSLNALNNNLARFIGPAAGGVALLLTGVGGVAVIDAVTFVIAAVMIGLIRGTFRAAAAAPDPSGAGRGLWRELTDGLRQIMSRHVLRVVFGLTLIISVGEGVFSVLIVAFVDRVLGRGGPELGVLMSAQAVGGLAGGLAGAALGPRLPARWLVGGSTILFGLFDLGLINYARWYPEFWPAPVWIALAGVPGAMLVAGVLSIVQTAVPDEYRGRVFAAYMTVFASLALLGSVLGGLLAEPLGVLPVLNTQGVGLVAGGLFVVLRLRSAATSTRSPRTPTPEPARSRSW